MSGNKIFGIVCPSCGSVGASVGLRFQRRRIETSCGVCGAPLVSEIPKRQYHIAEIIFALLGALVAPVLLIVILAGKWFWVCALIGLFFGIHGAVFIRMHSKAVRLGDIVR